MRHAFRPKYINFPKKLQTVLPIWDQDKKRQFLSCQKPVKETNKIGKPRQVLHIMIATESYEITFALFSFLLPLVNLSFPLAAVVVYKLNVIP